MVAIGLSIIFASFFFSRTLAGTISLGEGRSEFGQGVLLVTNCDATIYAQPKSETITASTFRLKGLAFWDINMSACDQRDFIARIYSNSGPIQFFQDTSEVKVRVAGGSFYSATPGVTLFPINEKGYFEFEIDNPTPDIIAGNLKRVTLESLKAGDPPACTPTINSGGSETSYSFSNPGICTFTSPVTKTASVTVVGGAAGGTGAPSGETQSSSSVALNQNAKYVLLIGRGGFVGYRGQASSGFGITAQPGARQSGITTGSAGADGNIVLTYGNN